MKRFVDWMKRVVPPRWMTVAAILVGTRETVRLLDWLFPEGMGVLLNEGSTRRVLIAGVPTAIGALYGLYRSLARNPISRPAYRTWLTHSCWTYPKPLPWGLIFPVWQDLVAIGLLTGSAIRSGAIHWPAASAMLCYSLGTVCLAAFQRPGRELYGVWAAVLAAVMFFNDPLWSLAALCVAVLLAISSMRRALESLSGTLVGAGREPEGDELQLGWPAAAMAPRTSDEAYSRIDGCLLAALLATSYFVLVTSYGSVGGSIDSDGYLWTIMFVFLAVMMRVALSFQRCSWPLTFTGRWRTGRWVMPRFDQVWIAPALMVLAAVAAGVGLSDSGLPARVREALLGGLVLTIGFCCPPSQARWRLTGEVRLRNAMPAPKGPRQKAGQ